MRVPAECVAAKEKHGGAKPPSPRNIRELRTAAEAKHCAIDAARSGDKTAALCGGKRVDVRLNWKERPTMPIKLRFD